MANVRIMWQGLVAIVMVTAATLTTVTTTPAQNNGKQEDGEGKYANLTALWWQWLFAQPAVDLNGTNTNPQLDTTGEFATVDQEGGIGPGNKYFFLAGTLGSDVERTVTVPEGKALFFPIINYEADNVFAPPDKPSTVPQLRARAAKDHIDKTTSTYARLDGEPVEIFRSKSPTFSYTVPEVNSLYAHFGLVGPQFEGRIKPAVADGYWAYIPPRPPGVYLLEFGGADSTGFSLNVTYLLTIE